LKGPFFTVKRLGRKLSAATESLTHQDPLLRSRVVKIYNANNITAHF
jgi:hypothetical protein